MNGALLLLISGGFGIAAYFLYGRFIGRVLGVDPGRETPAHALKDNVDYVPTRPSILFGHHFASIAGAGPIVGPVLAAQFGWLAVVLWVVLGCAFIGAVHDFGALLLSVRNQGRSIGTIIESLMGYWGRVLFLLFCLATLLLVIAQFTILVAETFISTPAVATASLLFIVLAVAFGMLVYRGGVDFLLASAVFVPLMFGCVYVGVRCPLDVLKLGCTPEGARAVWSAVLLAYCFAASVLPVWTLLQPRDYLNAYLLYAMIALGVAGIVIAAPAIQLPAFTGWNVPNPKSGLNDPVLPMLFVTIACGACSGFHALVASGTTAKQVANEKHLCPIAYGGMLLEGLLALVALITVAWMTQGEYAEGLKTQSEVSLFARGLAGFSVRLGLPLEIGITFVSLALAAFLMTTLDTATRLARFTWQELLLSRNASAPSPARPLLRGAFANRYTATTLAVTASAALVFSAGSKSLWPLFASANQLLAALSLLGVTLWLAQNGRRTSITLLPMIFMIAMSGLALINLCLQNVHAWRTGGFSSGGVLTIATSCLIALAVALTVFGTRRLLKKTG
ncbi:MAG: carbon starvation protein A [Kiritimatiellaeota bacterium]|nr:carbon starvation protein A [Kiritimatiellota bacterium]